MFCQTRFHKNLKQSVAHTQFPNNSTIVFQRAQNFHRLSPSGSLAFDWRKSEALFNQREHTVATLPSGEN
jgi:hypothetical protein